jgi:NAD(P)-dependent dehydrogenase (short-subunit alcohol dehydrogenase family)
MKIDFKGKTVLVTGATRGIGKRIADDFERSGARLILTGRSQGVSKNNRTYYSVDFTDSESTKNFINKIRKHGRIDICINNAGINKVNPIDKTLLEDWDDIMAVNLKAPFMIMREVSKIMKKNKYGRIINISSIYGVISKEGRVVYSSSKFGIRGLTAAASNELARHNVLVNAVSPGFVLTDLTKGILSAKEIKEISKEIPIRRFAMPEDISSVVLFLASELNTYITGQNIIVDGGYTNV